MIATQRRCRAPADRAAQPVAPVAPVLLEAPETQAQRSMLEALARLEAAETPEQTPMQTSTPPHRGGAVC
jgi:hypothetical protein